MLKGGWSRFVAWAPSIPRNEWGKYAFLGVSAFLVFYVLYGRLDGGPAPGTDPGHEVWLRILTSLGGAFLTPITVQLFISWLDEAKKPAQTAEFVSDLFLQSDGKLFDTVTRETRGNFLKNILISQTRDKKGDYGKDLGEGLVKGYFDDDQTYRDHFAYDISYQAFAGISTKAPEFAAFAAGIAERSEHYHWIDQTIRFTQHGLKAGDLKDVVVRLAFDDATLRKLLGDRDLIFREVIHLLPEEMSEISTLEDGQLAEFVRDVFKFNVSLGECGSEHEEVEHEFTVTWATRSDRRCIEIRVPHELAVTEGLVIRLAFQYPNRRNVTHFVAAAPRPVKQARISITGTPEMAGLSYFPFVAQFGQKPYTEFVTSKAIIIESATGRWWFPISGFVFVWDAQALPSLQEAAKPRRQSVKS